MNNNVYICNLQNERDYYNKSFSLIMSPQLFKNQEKIFDCNNTRRDVHVYKRGQYIEPCKQDVNTNLSKFNQYQQNINGENDLVIPDILYPKDSNKKFKNNKESDLYKLNVPHKKNNIDKSLLFKLPPLSSNNVPPIPENHLSFFNFTREQRNPI